jgi:hypothetical protein
MMLKTNDIFFRIFQTKELWTFWSFGRHKPEAGGFCLDLSLIVRGVSSEGGGKEAMQCSSLCASE